MLYVRPVMHARPLGVQKGKDGAVSFGGTYWQILYKIPFLLLAVATPVGIGLAYILMKDPKLTSLYVVFTGSRSYTPMQSSSYPIAVFNETARTRYFYCMQDLGIGTDVCKSGVSVYEFEGCVNRKMSCSSQTRHGFMDCLQSSFNVSVSQDNAWDDCVKTSMPPMFESIQNTNSGEAFGSYNYVAFLLSGMTILASFVVFSGGGVWVDYRITLNSQGHINKHRPMSIMWIIVAFVWNTISLCFAVGLMFESNGFMEYPVTQWTSSVVVCVFSAVCAFFLSYLVECYGKDIFDTAYVFRGATNHVVSENGQEGGEGDTVGLLPKQDSFSESCYIQPKPPSLGYRHHPGSFLGSSGTSGRIGYKLYETLPSKNETVFSSLYHVITPKLLTVYAWSLVFVDGLLFVGTMTSATSALSEDANCVFFGIIAVRLFQLSQQYFFNKGFISDESTSPTDQATQDKNNPVRFGMQLSALMIFIASLFEMANVLYRFMRTSEVWPNPSQTHGLQSLFLAVVCICPEAVRILQLIFLTSYYTTPLATNKFLLWSSEFLFAWNWMLRYVLAALVIAYIPNELKSFQDDLAALLSPANAA